MTHDDGVDRPHGTDAVGPRPSRACDAAVMEPPPPIDEQRRGLLLTVGVLRGALLVWATVVVVLDATGTTEVRLPFAAALLAVLATWSALAANWARQRSPLATSTVVVVVDVALGAAIAAADHLVYRGPHPQSFASAWPMTAAVVAGVTRGRSGAAAGLVIGAAGAIGTAASAPGGLDGRMTAALGTVVLLAVAGGLAGVLSTTLEHAELAVARSRAREEVARELHDGVLQTLAVVQRRSDDPALVALARDQELDLRRTLAEPTGDPHRDAGTDLLAALRATAARVESRTGLRCTLSVVEAPPLSSPSVVSAVAGAAGEALVNVHKHAGTDAAVLCVDVEDGELHCSITDDGRGFDRAATVEGTGLARSVRGRLVELGGRVEVASAPGRGTEVHLWCVPDSTHDR